MLVAAGTIATAQRNPVELFENGGFVSLVCSSAASSGFELYRRRQRKERRRSCWTKYWLLRHDEFNNLVREFTMNDDVWFRFVS